MPSLVLGMEDEIEEDSTPSLGCDKCSEMWPGWWESNAQDIMEAQSRAPGPTWDPSKASWQEVEPQLKPKGRVAENRDISGTKP